MIGRSKVYGMICRMRMQTNFTVRSGALDLGAREYLPTTSQFQKTR